MLPVSGFGFPVSGFGFRVSGFRFPVWFVGLGLHLEHCDLGSGRVVVRAALIPDRSPLLNADVVLAVGGAGVAVHRDGPVAQVGVPVALEAAE